MGKSVKHQSVFNYAMDIWRKDAIAKIRASGARIGNAPKNKVLCRLISEYRIDIYPPPKINDFISNEFKNNSGSGKSETTFSTESRKIKSTLPCPTKDKVTSYYDGITVTNTSYKSNNSIKPKGYKQKSKKSEKINIENFYDSWAWKDLRYQAIKKYGRRCMNCGQQPNKENKVTIHVDHIKPLRIYPDLALDINNLQVLCGDCNQGKGYWDETDFREKKEFSVSEESLSALHEYAQNNIN